MDGQDSSDGKKGKATPITKRIGEHMHRIRNDLGQTQRQFAEMMGVSFQQYQKYEKGRDRISFEKMILLCRSIPLPLTVFDEGPVATSGFAEMAQQGFDNGMSLTAEENEFVALFRALPKKQRKIFLENMRTAGKMA